MILACLMDILDTQKKPDIDWSRMPSELLKLIIIYHQRNETLQHQRLVHNQLKLMNPDWEIPRIRYPRARETSEVNFYRLINGQRFVGHLPVYSGSYQVLERRVGNFVHRVWFCGYCRPARGILLGPHRGSIRTSRNVWRISSWSCDSCHSIHRIIPLKIGAYSSHLNAYR